MAFILASATYFFIERPIRQQRKVVVGLTVAMGAVATVGILTVLGSGLSFRFPSDVVEIASLEVTNNPGLRPDCFLKDDDVASGERPRCIEGTSGPTIFVWGDSTAASLYSGLKEAQEKYSFRIAQLATAGCPPILGDRIRHQCQAGNSSAFEVINAKRPDIVLLHAMWGEDNDLENLQLTISELKGLAIPRIVVVGPVPVLKRSLPFLLFNSYRLEHRLPDRIIGGVAGQAMDARMEQFSNAQQVEYFSAWNRFCNSDGCLTRTGLSPSDVVAWDHVHLTKQGSAFLGNAVMDYLLPTDSMTPE